MNNSKTTDAEIGLLARLAHKIIKNQAENRQLMKKLDKLFDLEMKRCPDCQKLKVTEVCLCDLKEDKYNQL